MFIMLYNIIGMVNTSITIFSGNFRKSTPEARRIYNSSVSLNVANLPPIQSPYGLPEIAK